MCCRRAREQILSCRCSRQVLDSFYQHIAWSYHWLVQWCPADPKWDFWQRFYNPVGNWNRQIWNRAWVHVCWLYLWLRKRHCWWVYCQSGQECSTKLFSDNWRKWKEPTRQTWGCWRHEKGECWQSQWWLPKKTSNGFLGNLYVTIDSLGNTVMGTCASQPKEHRRWCPNAFRYCFHYSPHVRNCFSAKKTRTHLFQSSATGQLENLTQTWMKPLNGKLKQSWIPWCFQNSK